MLIFELKVYANLADVLMTRCIPRNYSHQEKVTALFNGFKKTDKSFIW